tara:strand:- start:5083 stop:5571 length:489 start_codon:yes stop_codon:yes gene_type:complete
MKKVLAVLGMTALILTACSDPQKEEMTQLQKDVIAVHDEVMPKMSTIEDLKASLDGIITEKEADTANVDSVTITLAREQIAHLEEAHNGMMDWMAGFELPEKDAPVDETIEYLKGQKTSVTAMADQMKSAIEEATIFVKDNGGEVHENAEASEEEHEHHHAH